MTPPRYRNPVQLLLGALAGTVLIALIGSYLTGLVFSPQPEHRSLPAASALERQIGQLIMVGFTGTSEKDTGVQAVAAQLASGRIGGVMLLSRNIESQEQLSSLTRYLAAQNPDTTVLIAVDQEGGQVQRLAPLGDAFTWMAAQDVPGRTDGCLPEAVTNYYEARAGRLAALGINLNFGPVVDLNSTPASPAIGQRKRSFSADPRLVGNCAAGFVDAHRAAGVVTALKHFPGHGSATADSHHGLPVIDTTWRESELRPYRRLAEQDRVDMVMMAHLVHRRFSDHPDRPASLSRKGLTAARATAGDSAVLITDDLEMDAVADQWPIEDAVIQAIAAGNDMVLASSYERTDPGLGDRLNSAIAAAVADGRLSPEQIERSAARILALKRRLGPPQS